MSDSNDEPTANDMPGSGRSAGGDGNFATGLRLGLASALGHSGFDRDRYEVFGWDKNPTVDQYYGLYLRNPYAYAAVAQKAATTWRGTPDIVDDTHDEDTEPTEDDYTEFEKRVRALENKKDLWSYASRADRLAGIGTHGVLVLDLDDTDGPEGFSKPPAYDEGDGRPGLDALRGFRVYSAASIEDIDYGKPGSDRWGMPETYQLDLRDDPGSHDSSPTGEDLLEVDHRRVIDIPAKELDDDEVHARPRIELVLNVVYDIEKSLGAAAELVYAGSKQDIHIDFDPDKVDASKLKESDDELQEWYHGRNPWIRTVGGEVEQISPPEIVDPSGVIDSELKAFSAATGIPQQLLDGSSAGELSDSKQNEKDYFGIINERRGDYAEPHIVRATLDRLVDLGILPAPDGLIESDGTGYRVEWPDLTELSEADIADLRNQRAQIVKRLQGAVPELSGERAEQFVEGGEFPERDEFDTVEPMDVTAEGMMDGSENDGAQPPPDDEPDDEDAGGSDETNDNDTNDT